MKTTKSLHAQHHKLADNDYQLKVLETHEIAAADFERFDNKLNIINLFPLKPTKTEIFQVNVGYMCNQTLSLIHI